MKKSAKKVDKSLRDKIMTEIALQYRENQKSEQKPQKVNIFSIWLKHDMPYSKFLDVILSLEAQGYLNYEKADKNKEKIHVKSEYVPQEFVTLEHSGKSFPETLCDERGNERKINLKYPIIVAIIVAIIGILSSSKSIGLLSQIAEWFLSLFHS